MFVIVVYCLIHSDLSVKVIITYQKITISFLCYREQFAQTEINLPYLFLFFSVENDEASEKSESENLKPEEIRKNPENSGAMMVDSGVDSEASSPDSGGSEKIPAPPRPDLLLETAETLLALSGKPSSQSTISPRKGINLTHLLTIENF